MWAQLEFNHLAAVNQIEFILALNLIKSFSSLWIGPQSDRRLCWCFAGAKWSAKTEPEPSLRGCRGVITLPSGLLSDRYCGNGSGSYRGRGDRRHSGPCNYGSSFHHAPPTDGNDFGSYSGGYRGRGRPLSGRGSGRWSSSHFSDRGGGRGGFARGGGRYDNNNRGRNFDTRNRGPSGDNFAPKYYGNCEVRPARGATKQRGFYHSSSTSTPAFP